VYGDEFDSADLIIIIMEKQQYAERVTRVTLLSHLIGFVTVMVNPLFACIIIPVLVFPKFIPTFIASH
jgi:hypothetical protein